MSTDILAGYRQALEGFSADGRLRRLPEAGCAAGMTDLSSNDYLGLAKRGRELAEEFLATSACRDFSSSASRLLSARQEQHNALEGRLDALYGKRTLLFNSGYHANCGAISALALPGTALIADKLAHASMIDGLTLSRCRFDRFRHNDMAGLRRLLEKHSDAERQLVIVESVYSMDGDEAPLAELISLRREHPKMMLYLDEAHAFGVRGRRGLGLAEELGVLDQVDVLVGTFGKAAASTGAFVAASEEVRDYLLNAARSFIFSTALPPINIAYTRFLLDKITGMAAEREHLSRLSASFRSAIERATGEPCPSRSQIVPWMAGSAERAVERAALLRRNGFLALPIRRPTVAAGTERIRFSLSADLTADELSPLTDLISSLS